jgi:hypothetical protein
MLYDLRTYTCRPGTIGAHLDLYAREGYAIQSRHLGAPLLYAATETGALNSYVHIWVYESADDRAKRRAALQADPEWKDYLKKSSAAAYLVSQENRLLSPVSFFAARQTP